MKLSLLHTGRKRTCSDEHDGGRRAQIQVFCEFLLESVLTLAAYHERRKSLRELPNYCQ
jgi:hypothetical protein